MTKTKIEKSKKPPKTDKPPLSKIKLIEGMNLKDLCLQLKIKAKDVIGKLAKQGINISVNNVIDDRVAQILSQELGLEINIVSLEEEVRAQALSKSEDLVPRPPVVTIMGHVDHGKTTLLDAIRESNIVSKESGGITQHIGAYRVSYNNRSITFIDTPGHEAFTKLRARGAKITDIVVLVVAADDGVMPQTREAINHAQAAGVPIIVAINKIDKPEADLDKTKQQLSKEGLLVEEWGGDTICIELSAKEKTNLNELLDMILLLSDVIEIKANPKVKAQGVILEARLDVKKGPLATVIIQQGTLHLGEAFVAGLCYGKVRALFDENGKPIRKAELSMPVEVLGFSEVPEAGDIFQAVADFIQARQVIQFRKSQIKKEEIKRPERLTLDDLFKKIAEGETKELPLIIKADVQGSVEVLKDILPNLSNEKIKIKIIHAATGNINESDVLLASASKAIIIAYNTKPSGKIPDLAKEENVEIRSYNVIYQLTEDIKKALTGMLEPTIREKYLGRAEVRRIFNIPRIGVVAGCYVLDGKITRNAEVKVIRNNEVIHKGRIASLKHLKNNVTEVTKEYECGLSLEKFKDIQEGDIIEAFITEKVSSE
ncbi:MAG: translation initiation factor IF-2 [Candidatus Aminicenantales bacterium]